MRLRTASRASSSTTGCRRDERAVAHPAHREPALAQQRWSPGPASAPPRVRGRPTRSWHGSRPANPCPRAWRRPGPRRFYKLTGAGWELAASVVRKAKPACPIANFTLDGRRGGQGGMIRLPAVGKLGPYAEVNGLVGGVGVEQVGYPSSGDDDNGVAVAGCQDAQAASLQMECCRVSPSGQRVQDDPLSD
jgi:hypothetical protein